ncbi:MAG: geranylgeranyl reductase family protein [Candidatus Thermoplasmatota archaeon]|nr:geranylgeranyl reductase family protein [Candidatus Thermoplasmatota archaeon]
MKYDVIVVGAGPAGSTAAKTLAEKGISVLILDKATFPRDKPCGGGLPTRVQKRFSYIEPFLDSVSYGTTIFSSSLRYRCNLVREKPFLGMVLRKDFDNRLLSLAQNAGAIFLGGKSVVDVVIQKEKVSVVLEDGQTMETQMVIGSDGMYSVVAEKTQLSKKLRVLCVSLTQEQPMTPEELTTFFTKKRIIYLFIKAHGIAGYAWVFPKKNCVNIGIGEFQSALSKEKPRVPLKETYEQFIATLKEKHLLPTDFPVENLKGATLPIFPLKNTCGDRVLLCGDAAGFINPITGEGIYYAMVSGKIAADVIAEGLKSHDLSHRFLSRYQTLWNDDFGKDLKALGRFNNQWGKDSERIVRLMMRDKKFARLIIGVTGGQISFRKYRAPLFLRYLYLSLKNLFRKKEK